MALLKDMPLSTPWPGPEGGTLGTVPLNTQYGASPFSIRNAPINTTWPPVFDQPTIGSDLPIGMRIAWGGTGVEGETHFESLAAFGLGAWKAGPGYGFKETIIAANPNCRILAYKTMWELGTAANSPTAIDASNTTVSYAEAQAHDAANPGDPWILKDGAGNPITDSFGMHFADVSKASYQARCLSNLLRMLSNYSFRNSKDGIWIDNCTPYLWVTNPTYGFNGVGGAAWNAALSWCTAVLGALKAQGWYVTGNMLGDWSGEANNYSVTKQWHTANKNNVNGPWLEGASYKVNSTGAMRTGADWVNVTKAMQTNAQNNGMEWWPELRSTVAAELENVIYAHASYLLNWDGIKRSVLSTGGLNIAPNTLPNDTYHAAWRTDVGLPTTPAQVGGEQLATYQFRRQYQKAYVWVNADPSASITITSSPDGRAYKDYNGVAVNFPLTLGPSKGLVLYSDTWIGTGGGGTGAAAQKTSAFSDNFNDNSLDAQWTPYANMGTATVAESGQQLNLAVPLNTGKYAGVTLLASDLTGSSCFAILDPGSITSTQQEVNFGVMKDASNEFFWNVIYNGSARVLRAYKIVNGVGSSVGTVAATYAPATTHKYLRLRESGGTVFYETSPDGITWTTQFSTVADFTPNNVKVFFEAGQDSTTAPAIAATLDGFNTTPAALTYDAEILAEAALLHYYKLDETAGTGTAADSKGTNTLTSRAGVTQGAAGMIVGDAAGAVSLDGNTGYLDQTAGTDFGPTSGSWAIELWMDNTGPGTNVPNDYGSLVGRDGSHRILIQTGGTGGQKLLAQFGGVNLFSTGDVLQSAVHHIVLGYDSTVGTFGQLNLYIDGALNATIACTAVPTLAGRYALGAYDLAGGTPTSGYMFKGKLQKVAVYNALLGATKVSSHNTNGTT